MIFEWVASWARILLTHDQALQTFGLVCSCCGVWWSAWLFRETHRDYQALLTRGSLVKRLIADSHRRTQGVVLVVQLCFALMNLLVLALPPVPIYTMAPQILVVITIRKLLRTFLILLLMWAMWRQRRVRLFVFQLLDDAS